MNFSLKLEGKRALVTVEQKALGRPSSRHCLNQVRAS